MNTVHNKLRTPKNESFNQLIGFINKKYNFTILKSYIDTTDLLLNSWFAGFTEADGHFGIKIVDSKPKSFTRKRSVSDNISLRFVLDQRLIDKKTSLSMLNIMEKISQTLLCNLTTYKSKNNEILSIKVVAMDKIKSIINYFNRYPLLGIKSKDFKDWEIVYHMMVSKMHLTNKGRSQIKLIQSNMNTKRKYVNKGFSILNSQVNFSVLLIILIGFTLLNIPYVINSDLFISMVNTDYLILNINHNDTIKGTLEAKNIKIENVDIAVEKVRDGAIYIGGMAAAAKIMKTSSLPLGAKLGSVIGMGAASLISYKMIQNNLGHKSESLNLKAEQLNTVIGTSNSSNNDTINKFVEGAGKSNGNTDNFLISALDLEQLHLDFYLHLVILYLLVILFVIMIMKSISKRNLKFEFVQKLPFGPYLQTLLLKLFNWWDKTNDIWIYLILIVVFFSLIISAWSIYIIIGNIH